MCFGLCLYTPFHCVSLAFGTLCMYEGCHCSEVMSPWCVCSGVAFASLAPRPSKGQPSEHICPGRTTASCTGHRSPCTHCSANSSSHHGLHLSHSAMDGRNPLPHHIHTEPLLLDSDPEKGNREPCRPTEMHKSFCSMADDL